MDYKNKKELYQKIKRLLVKKVDPKTIFIFGSYANNTETENSDIDILIEKETTEPLYKRAVGIRSLLKEIDSPIDLLIYSPNEISQKLKNKYSIVYQAIHKGIKIYGK